jgi:hypothetical protein
MKEKNMVSIRLSVLDGPVNVGRDFVKDFGLQTKRSGNLLKVL